MLPQITEAAQIIFIIAKYIRYSKSISRTSISINSVILSIKQYRHGSCGQ